MIKLSRKENWPKILAEYIRKKQGKKFVWGKNDCCTFVAGSVKLMTGHDFYKEFRGTYNDEDSAREALKTIGNGSLYQVLLKNFGKTIPVAYAQRGDIVMDRKTMSIGICDGVYSWFLGALVYGDETRPDGIVQKPTIGCDYAFKVARN